MTRTPGNMAATPVFRRGLVEFQIGEYRGRKFILQRHALGMGARGIE
jgi:hypothetical protein